MTKSKNRKKRRPYPQKYREERAKLIKKTQPWKSATGPHTDEGKAKAAQNAFKHGARSATFNALRKALHENQKQLDALPKKN